MDQSDSVGCRTVEWKVKCLILRWTDNCGLKRTLFAQQLFSAILQCANTELVIVICANSATLLTLVVTP